MSELTHLDAKRQAHMVTVSAKAETHRGAVATAQVTLSQAGFVAVRDGSGPKGDAVQVARLAAIAATKRTADLIPLCHPIRLTRVAVEATLREEACQVTFEVTVEAVDRTGVEMEAMTGASVAALTLYDMVKAVDRSAVIGPIYLLEKWGGKSGHFRA